MRNPRAISRKLFDAKFVMSIIHIMQSKELIKLLTKAGWIEVRSVGSHHQFKHPNHKEVVTVPHPKKDLPIGTVNNILKAAGLK